MVEIDSNTILVEPISGRNNAELTQAYRALMLHLKQACIVPKKHVLDNEVSKARKTVIREEYKMEMELIPQDAIAAMQQRWTSEISSHIFSAYSLG